jgi:hypothetical protein
LEPLLNDVSRREGQVHHDGAAGDCLARADLNVDQRSLLNFGNEDGYCGVRPMALIINVLPLEIHTSHICTNVLGGAVA